LVYLHKMIDHHTERPKGQAARNLTTYGEGVRRQRPYADIIPRSRITPPYANKTDSQEKKKSEVKELSDKRKRLVVFFVIVTLLIITLGLYTRAKSNTIPSAIRTAQVSYTIYFPKQLPKGLKMTSDATSNRDVLTFRIASHQGGNIVVSQQMLPSRALTTKLPATKEIQVAAGKATISRFTSNQSVVTITNSQSFLTLNIKDKLSDDTLIALLESFQPIN
jgi:hypothetical protein